MAPTLPRFRPPRGRRGECAAAAITISSSSSESFSSTASPGPAVQSWSNTLVILSSATFSAGSAVAAVVVPDTPVTRGAGGGDDRGGGGRSDRRRPPSAVPVRSSTVVTAASFANGSGRGRKSAAPRRSPSPCSVLSVRAPGGGGGGGDDEEEEATSRPRKKYRKWRVEDERKILDTLAKLRKDNLGVPTQASVLLDGIRADGGLLRRGVDATDLADKVSKLKTKFKKAVEKLAASGRRRLRNSRDRVLYEASKEAWPELVPGHRAAAVRLQRRGNNARVGIV